MPARAAPLLPPSSERRSSTEDSVRHESGRYPSSVRSLRSLPPMGTAAITAVGDRARGGRADVQEVLAGTSTVTTRLLLRAAAERGGPEAVERALRRAGLAGEAAQLNSLRGRVAYEVKLRLFDAVAAEVGDPRIGLALGDVALTDPALAPLRGAVRALGSPATVLRQVSRISTRLDTAAGFRCTDSSDRRGGRVLQGGAPPPPRPRGGGSNTPRPLQPPPPFFL